MTDLALFTGILTLTGVRWHRSADHLGTVIFGSINEAVTWTVLFETDGKYRRIRRLP